MMTESNTQPGHKLVTERNISNATQSPDAWPLAAVRAAVGLLGMVVRSHCRYEPRLIRRAAGTPVSSATSAEICRAIP
ncbi:protein of unknown function [Modestobacter italicus]|uniref:Uncharacterized protein n=1 Tax=Modestobacter italicus (strain DSM 44449 / CECT 9708 / BC 501) TaxID=2732864 RepID=I4F0V9_MODI5|nr:protein of unknown function [Modestobacter marinus]